MEKQNYSYFFRKFMPKPIRLLSGTSFNHETVHKHFTSWFENYNGLTKRLSSFGSDYKEYIMRYHTRANKILVDMKSPGTKNTELVKFVANRMVTVWFVRRAHSSRVASDYLSPRQLRTREMIQTLRQAKTDELNQALKSV